MSTFHIRHLHLVDFRTYSTVELDFPSGPTAFVGANGMGKTNIIEAIGYLSTLSSHRVAADAPLVRQGAGFARVAADVVRDDRALRIEVDIIPGAANRARINNSPTPRARDILGIVHTVLFAPEDLAIVKGDPSERRRMLDEVIVQRNPRLAGVRSDYDRVLKQRNALLKSAHNARRSNTDAVEATLAVWDEQLIEHGAAIMVARSSAIDALTPLAAVNYSRIAPASADLGMQYVTTLGAEPMTDVQSTSDRFREAITARRKDELDRGVTLVGPHRDDLSLTIGEFPVKGYASHGESWSVALALRLGTYDLLEAEQATPILILDDVFAELDAARRRHLAERVASAPQVFITAAVAEDVPAEVDATWFDVVKSAGSAGFETDASMSGSGMVTRRE